MINLVLLDALTLGDDLDLSILEKFGRLTIYPTTQPNEVSERIKDKEVVITNKVVLNENNLSLATNLKLICITATGTNNVDLKYAAKKNIAVTNVSGYSTNSVAQHTFAMLFYLLEHLAFYDNYARNRYQESEIFTCLKRPYRELTGKTWGIIGLGNIGRRVASLAQAFGCNVIYYSTSGLNVDSFYPRVELAELLQKADIISIHAPLTEKTTNLIAAQEFKLMKKQALLLNLGRGGIVNEEDLARALEEELIAGAALDVLSHEPVLKGHPLLGIKNKERLLITPHIAWASVEARQKLLEEVVLNIEAFMFGQRRNRVT